MDFPAFLIGMFGLIASWAAAGAVVGMALGMLLMKAGSLIWSAFRRIK
jgi:hypothetical protein